MVTIGDPYQETPRAGHIWRTSTRDVRIEQVRRTLEYFPELEILEAHRDGRVVVRLKWSDMPAEKYGSSLRAAERELMKDFPWCRVYLAERGDINALRRVTRGIQVLEGFAGEDS